MNPWWLKISGFGEEIAKGEEKKNPGVAQEAGKKTLTTE